MLQLLRINTLDAVLTAIDAAIKRCMEQLERYREELREFADEGVPDYPDLDKATEWFLYDCPLRPEFVDERIVRTALSELQHERSVDESMDILESILVKRKGDHAAWKDTVFKDCPVGRR